MGMKEVKEERWYMTKAAVVKYILYQIIRSLKGSDAL